MNMSKERYNEIIDEVYENYLKNFTSPECPPNLDVQPNYYEPMYKETFMFGIKTNKEFSEKWGLQIVERELSLEDRKKIYEEEFVGGFEIKNDDWLESKLKTRNIPTKKITVTYNNENFQFYE